ncbi:MAG: ABC transporter permease [Chloroflexota bacterium]|nr:ABC transporter permease [Chloroflexota bacterium]
MQHQGVAVPTTGALRGFLRVLTSQLVWWARFCRRKPLGAFGLFVVLFMIFAAIAAPILQTHDPFDQNYLDALQGPRLSHWFGTDDYGRDLYSRVVHGARISVTVAFVSVFIGTSLGMLIGLVSAYTGGWVDSAIQRLIEIKQAIPSLVLAILLVAVFSAGIDKVIIALSITFIPGTVRVVRGTVLQVKSLTYVEAARAIGARPWRIMLRHIAPNVFAPYLIVASTLLSTAVLVEASLAYLGLSVPPPAPSWGRMLQSGAQLYALTAPHLVIIPGLAIALLVLAFNLFGDALRDVLDPRLRGGR